MKVPKVSYEAQYSKALNEPSLRKVNLGVGESDNSHSQPQRGLERRRRGSTRRVVACFPNGPRKAPEKLSGKPPERPTDSLWCALHPRRLWMKRR